MQLLKPIFLNIKVNNGVLWFTYFFLFFGVFLLLLLVYLRFQLENALQRILSCKFAKFSFLNCLQSLRCGVAFPPFIAQKLKFSIKDFFNKCVQINSFLRISSQLLKKSLTENLSFWAVFFLQNILVI